MECDQIAIAITADGGMTWNASAGVQELRREGYIQATCHGWLVQITELPGARPPPAMMAGAGLAPDAIIRWQEDGNARYN